MKQSFLKAGDLIVYNKFDSELFKMGFVVGRAYEIKPHLYGDICIEAQVGGRRALLTIEGEFNDFSDHFSKDNSSIILPRGHST